MTRRRPSHLSVTNVKNRPPTTTTRTTTKGMPGSRSPPLKSRTSSSTAMSVRHHRSIFSGTALHRRPSTVTTARTECRPSVTTTSGRRYCRRAILFPGVRTAAGSTFRTRRRLAGETKRRTTLIAGERKPINYERLFSGFPLK